MGSGWSLGDGFDSEVIRVLVADDNELNAALIREHLESLGYAVDWASDADHAIALAASRRYHVMLLNVHLRVHSGMEVMRRLHLLSGRPVRVIALNVDGVTSQHRDVERMGIDGCMTKPLDLRKLEQELNRVLRRSSL